MRGVRIWILGWCIGFWGVRRIKRGIFRVRRIRFGYNILANLELGKSSERFCDLAFGTEISHEYRVLKL